ncbi:thylakoid membrane protein TERC, chloroplastic [Phoenix dactylifera]|uniref:Thylakoid membrane protein TERC, chloroplastic n=1 Tax=Phoenix dactylifera TaxID=42345 RepID=A0A8B7C800_PHODC|nr:thylakoid membrane protein TERC, chloroplastic [Phoenix dactylifera]
MGFAPPIHHSCLQITPRFGPELFRARPRSTLSFSFASSLRHASASSCFISSVGSRRYGTRLLRMRHAKETEQEGLSISEEVAKTSSQSHDGLNIDGKAASDPPSGGKQDSVTRKASSARTVAFWVFAAVTFGVALGIKDGIEKASEFFAGYLLEQSLSVDNLFVFVLIFRYFKVPKMYQGRVLTYGIAGAIIFRATMILLGAATLQRFEAVNLLLALILLFSSYKLFSAEEEETDLADNFIVKTCQKFIPITAYYDGDRFLTLQAGVWKATPLLLTVAVIELSDIAFAVDSIPAVFGVTRDPFIVFSSNLFAISGLRSLYILVSESMSELEYLQPAIGIVLGFLGTKMIFDFFGYHVPIEVSLGFVATSLSAGVLLSLIKNSD